MKWSGKIKLILTMSLLSLCSAASPVISDTTMTRAVDIRFLHDASTSNTWMISLGEMALRQAAGLDVREFSRRMIEDQKRIGRDLERLSDRKGLRPAIDRDIVRQNTTAYLSKEYGAAFDRLYMSLLMDEHQRNVILFKEEIEKGEDGDVRMFARRILGTLEAYVEAAKRILTDMPKPLLK